MTPKDQKSQFKSLIQNILLQVEIPGPLKLIAKKQIESRLESLKDDEVPEIIQLALRFCVVGIEKFSDMLGLQYVITIKQRVIDLDSQEVTNFQLYHNSTLDGITGDTARSDGQSSLIRSNRFGQNDASEVPARA